MIGTRPDCIDEGILDYLGELNRKYFITLEYGIESCYDKTLVRINRGHDFKTSKRAVFDTAERGIRVGGHMIIGLPGESRDDILQSAEILSDLPLNQLKFHQLQIVKGTLMGKDYSINPGDYKEFGLEEYLLLMTEYLERLNPSIQIERIAGETVPQYNMRPSWGLRYDQVLNAFEQLMETKGSWQGKSYRQVL